MAGEKFCLRWNDFESNISVAFRELREDKDFFDVTLACDEEQIQAHKVILAACSPFFRGVLKRNPHAHPLLYLKGVKYADLVAVLSFMYHGEVNVAQEDLNSFLAVAEELKVKGLTQGDQQTSKPPSQKRSSPQEPPPPPKRPRPPPPPVARLPAEEEDDVQEVEMPAVKAEPQNFQQQQEEAGQHSLAVEEGYEEGYEEDYGQYEEGYGMVGQAGAEGNKGNLDLVYTSFQKLDVNLFQCLKCPKTCAQKHHIINHIENQHYPGNYPCQFCQKLFNSHNSRHVHVKRNHLTPQTYTLDGAPQTHNPFE